ncbi:MAG: acyl carrier protein [Rhodospirillaceae bacterium]|nr:acyl carrier protein [Rhodospirillaceae bacterium]
MELVDTVKGRDGVLHDTIEVLRPFRRDGQPITPETDLTKDLNLDSLAVMDLMMALEERFDVSIPLNVVPELRTVADLADKISAIKGES